MPIAKPKPSEKHIPDADPARERSGRDPQVTELIGIARHIEAHSDQRLTLATLSGMAGLSPSRFQKVFKNAFGVSPKAYQDAIRMRLFKQALTSGGSVTDAIFESGFSSVSRIYGEPSRTMGMAPKTYRSGAPGEHIVYCSRPTRLGLLLMAATAKGICFAQFGDSEQALLAALAAEFPRAALMASPAKDAPELDAWMIALDRHISDGAPRPELPLDMRGTAFQVKVWQFLLSIPEGDVVSYRQVAENIGSPRATRAAASACGKNRIAVLIPCHRVLRGDGGLGGYRWGLQRKTALLEAERKNRPD